MSLFARGLSPILPALSLLAVASVAIAGDIAPGHRYFGPSGSTDTVIVDNAGKVVRKIPSAFEPGIGVHMLEDGTFLRTIRTGNGHNIGGVGGGIQRLRIDGSILWDWRFDGPGFVTHHDIWPLPNRNILVIVWEDKAVAQAVAAGRDPASITGYSTYLPDAVVEVKPTGPTTGAIVWEWHAFDHLIQDFDATKPNFGVVKDNPGRLNINHPAVINPASGAPGVADWMHCNEVAYNVEHDWVILNSPNFNEFWIIDHSTTTAEAASHSGGTHGKGGDFIYRWGNPNAYKAGTPAEQKLFFQHGAHFIPAGYPGAGNVILFNNNFMSTFSAVQEFALPIDAQGGFTQLPNGTYGPSGPVWEYTNPPSFFSKFISNAVRLPNGNTLIDSGAQGWIFEVKPDKTKVTEHFNAIPAPGSIVFRADYTERTLWSDHDTVSAVAGATVDFEIVAGSNLAGKNYLLLGSLSGAAPGFTIQGHHVPLNIDPYFNLTASLAGSGLLPGSVGTLDSLGNATAHLVLPPGAASPILSTYMQHAYVVFDSTTGQVLHASNPVQIQIQH